MENHRMLEFLFLCHRWLSSLSLFITDEDHIVSKTYMTGVKGENSRLRHYLLNYIEKHILYSKSEEMLKFSIRLVIHYLKYVFDGGRKAPASEASA